MHTIIFALLAVGAGACIALQASANGKFRQNIDEPLSGRVFLDPGNGPHGHHRNDDPPTARAQRSRSPLNGLVELDWRPARRTHRASPGAALTRKDPAPPFIAACRGRADLLCSLLLDHTHCWVFRPSPSQWAALAQPSWWLGWCASSTCDGYLGFFGPYLVRSISFSFSPRLHLLGLARFPIDAGGNPRRLPEG